MSELLLVVDVQRGFLNDFTRHVPERIIRLIETGTYDPVVFTRFVNTADSPYVRLLDWRECQAEPATLLAPELEALAEPSLTFEKHGYTGLPEPVAAYLHQYSVERVTLVGIDTDMCVLKTAMDLFDLGIRPVVLTDCCASTAGLQAHLAGLAILSRNIGPHQLRDAGLGEGEIAAPRAVSGKS